jgi:hypothetical protein
MTTMTVDEKRGILERANAIPLTVNGVAVQVSGAANGFATVTVKSGHPLAGFSAEYGWHAVDHAVRYGYKLRA